MQHLSSHLIVKEYYFYLGRKFMCLFLIPIPRRVIKIMTLLTFLIYVVDIFKLSFRLNYFAPIISNGAAVVLLLKLLFLCFISQVSIYSDLLPGIIVCKTLVWRAIFLQFVQLRFLLLIYNVLFLCCPHKNCRLM